MKETGHQLNHIRHAELSDIDALVQLRIEYLQEDLGPLEKSQIRELRELLPAYFRTHLGKDLFCYLKPGGEDIAACAFLLVVEKPMSPAFGMVRRGPC